MPRARVTSQDRYAGLFADLDADGHDDLWFGTPGIVEFRSGRDGSLRFSFTDPRLGLATVAADHDSDGADDVMVFLDDTANSVKLQLVLSGQNGAVLETFQFPYLATSQRWVSWVGDVDGTSRPRIRHRLRPRLGDAMLIDLQGGAAGGFVCLAIGTALDLDLAPFGAPGNRAYVLPFGHVGRIADAHGLARSALAVPNAPALVGTAASLQWAVFDPAVNALGLATSNALDVVIGH